SISQRSASSTPSPARPNGNPGCCPLSLPRCTRRPVGAITVSHSTCDRVRLAGTPGRPRGERRPSAADPHSEDRMPLRMTAYIDESLRVRDRLYILAAVIVADADADQHRQALASLLYRGQIRLHWRNESNPRREDLVAAVSRLRHTGAIVIGTEMASDRQER